MILNEIRESYIFGPVNLITRNAEHLQVLTQYHRNYSSTLHSNPNYHSFHHAFRNMLWRILISRDLRKAQSDRITHHVHHTALLSVGAGNCILYQAFCSKSHYSCCNFAQRLDFLRVFLIRWRTWRNHGWRWSGKYNTPCFLEKRCSQDLNLTKKKKTKKVLKLDDDEEPTAAPPADDDGGL